MKKYITPLSYCAFCNRSLIKSRDKNRQNAVVAVICTSCERDITKNLGIGWTTTDWWKEFKESYVREEHERVRNRDWSFETLKEQEESGYTRNIPVSRIDGTRINVPVGTLRSVIRRLNQSYGYGARRISKILLNTYKIQISSVGVTHHLTDMRRNPELTLITNDDSKFWQDWHEELNRLEREKGRREKIYEQVFSEGSTEESSDDNE